MKRKRLFVVAVVMAAALLAGGWWLAHTSWRADAAESSERSAGEERQTQGAEEGQMLRPPDPNRKFEKLSPEERVKLARKGPVGG
jgi:hypothetical protein